MISEQLVAIAESESVPADNAEPSAQAVTKVYAYDHL